MARKTKKQLDWIPFKKKIGTNELEGQWALDGRILRVTTNHGSKSAMLNASNPESLALMLALELAKGLDSE